MSKIIPYGQELEKQEVFMSGKQITSNSLVFAKRFGVEHLHLLEKIRKLTNEYSIVKKDFIPSTFLNKRNREYPYYEITRDGFMMLVMNAGTPKNKESREEYYRTQQEFIKAFNLMESSLLNQSNLQWNHARQQGKLARRSETDALQELLEYIKRTEPDSTYTKMPNLAYSNYTKMTYKCLAFIENKKPKTRDILDVLELSQLFVAEDIVSKVIRKGLSEKEHYKVIYQNCKIALERYANSVLIG